MVNGFSQSQAVMGTSNVTGATPTTREIAAYSYQTQLPHAQDTFEHITSKDKPSYKWPIIGAVVSTLSLIGVSLLRKGK